MSDILNQIQEGIFKQLKSWDSRENLLIHLGYEAQIILQKEISIKDPYVNTEILQMRDPEGLKIFGVKIRRGYETREIVIFDPTERVPSLYKITL
jgi:hypothetical protein